GEANAIIVHSLDRFGRNQDQQAVAYVAIQKAGGRLISATEDLSGEGALASFLRSAVSLASALELEKIRERVQRSQDARFRQPEKSRASTRPPFGYSRLADGTYAVHPDEAATVRRIFTERAS